MTVDLSNIYFPENIYASWLSVSFLLITLSLLFYHMARVSSIEMNTKIAGTYSVLLITIACIYSIISIFPYYTRFKDIYNKHRDNVNLSKEYLYHKLYIGCGIFVVIIQLLIAYSIIRIEYIK